MSALSEARTWATSWRAALRISRREALRNRSRNLLIVAMLALPVFGATAVQTILDSVEDLSPQERLTRVLGRTDAFIDPTIGTPITVRHERDWRLRCRSVASGCGAAPVMEVGPPGPPAQGEVPNRRGLLW